MVRKGQREHFTDFLQRLSKTVKIGDAVPDSRQILLEPLAFENAN